MIVRDATPDDAPAIAAIWNPIVRDTAITFWPTERPAGVIAAMISDRQALGHAFLVADRGGDAPGTICGFATYGQFRAGGGYAKSLEHTIHLAPEARGSGAAPLLLGRVEDHARQAGGRLMIGAVTGSNDRSVRFHTRQGYAVWGRIPAAGWKFGQFHDLVLMGKDLSART